MILNKININIQNLTYIIKINKINTNNIIKLNKNK